MSKVSIFHLPVGQHIDPERVAGYYIDLRSKAETPTWPPAWFPFPGFHRYIAIGQWGLGCFERFVAGEGEEWLAPVVDAAQHLVDVQESDGAWPEPEDYPHTLRMRGPWLSGMAQGHCVSLLVRAHREAPSQALADAARAGLRPLTVPSVAGGVEARLDGGTFPEEYPTEPPSFVLNGAIYAVWGAYDVWRGLGDDDAGELFRAMVETLTSNIRRYDLGYWSRYDLYPHPGFINVASSSYHALHINQLQALNLLAPHPELADAAARFESYRESRFNRVRAFAHKGFFRLVVPRNHLLSGRLPWLHGYHARQKPRVTDEPVR
jgi:heparosan-N-sulfate-glucuronate 5-epimerase